MKNGSKDFSAFLHEVRGSKSKFGSTAGFFAKNLNFALFGFLWSKWPKIRLFANFLENGSNDFANLPYLDRLDQYLQLLYWHQVRQKSSWPFRGHFMSTILAFSKKNNFKSTFFDFESSDRSDTAYYASIKWVEAFTKDRRSKFFF